MRRWPAPHSGVLRNMSPLTAAVFLSGSILRVPAEPGSACARVLAAEVLLEEVHGALPGQGRRGFVVARGGVVVESVLRPRIDEQLEFDVVGFERGFEGR